MSLTRRDVWPTEGSQHHRISRDAIYQNSQIESFLDNDQSMLVIAAKGMGKTLILRIKKKLLEEGADGQLIIPRHTEFDEPQFTGDLPVTSLAGRDRLFWRDIWKLSLLLSILSHRHSYSLDRSVSESINALQVAPSIKRDFLELFRARQKLPSYFLNSVLARELSVVERMRRSIHVFDSLSTSLITSGTCVFVDAFDQTLTTSFSHDLETWCQAQLGLLDAANRLNTQNSHVKIYASIRQEA